MRNQSIHWIFAVSAGISCAGTTQAAVELFTDFAEWQAAAGSYSTVDFTGFPMGTFITDQYSALGVAFTDGNDSIQLTPGFTLDGAGLDGNGPTDLAFVQSMTAFAIHFPGVAQVQLLSGGDSLYLSPPVSGGGAGALGFLGVISTRLFDAARLIDPVFGDADIDNLYFGPPIPAPATIVLLTFASILHKRRRRC